MKIKLAFAFISVISFQAHAMEDGKENVSKAKYYVEKPDEHGNFRYESIVFKAIKKNLNYRA